MNVSYFPGCTLHGTAREYAGSAEAVAEKLNIKLQELDGWNCCGAASAHAVSDSLAFALSARNLQIADKAKRDLVVPCAACYQRLKLAEKRLLSGESGGYGGKLQIKYLVNFFSEVADEKTIISKVKKPLTGLNPVCYYGCLAMRPPQVTGQKNAESPDIMDRLMKNLGVAVKNWSYKTECCGGDLIFTRPEIAMKMSKKVLDMALEAGADSIVTGCPLCQSNLDTRQAQISKDSGKEYNLPVFYFTELMGLAFGDPSVGKWLGGHLVDPRPLLKQKRLIASAT